MPCPDFIMLYVNNPSISAEFYTDLLNKQPVELSPTFVMFILDKGIKFGLWSKAAVEPSAILMGGGCELAFTVANQDEVDNLYKAWKERGVVIIQDPTEMGFGYTFVAMDPDGHRLRVYTRNPSMQVA